ncbi:Qat anti-phage system TatD family nuclease QatD [Delftia tsuruhatensis]|uniref:Qat anti-phage system TatD family nuclease QatD n=1 Tax=Delftia tsuruhatensis TaxID=180282 RepID=UPI00289B5161|nr:Qat anti-phage system TatD family nuclease QatD [Delftia tsuruhatensis]
MIDFHCHVDLYPDAFKLLPEINTRNRFTFAVTTSPNAYLATSKILKPYRHIRVGLGLHPEIAIQKAQELDLLLELIPVTRLIGEIGLDGSARFRNSLPVQENIFRAALEGCQTAGGKVMSIHSRGAERLVLEYLRGYPNAGTPVLHWFSGSLRQLETAIDQGCWFSVGPAMLRGEKGRRLAAAMPRNRVLPESDGPFSESVGRPLMPWEAWDICDTLPDLWGLSRSEVAHLMIDNLGRMPGFRNISPT